MHKKNEIGNTAYSVPADQPRCDDVVVRIDGQPAGLCQTGVATFATCSLSGAADIELTFPEPVENVVVRPQRLGITPEIDDCRVRFRLDTADSVSVDMEGRQPVYLFVSPPDEDIPGPDDPGVHYFPAGAVHNVGLLEVGTDETVYIEGGAVLRGAIHAADGANIGIRGHGILDGWDSSHTVEGVHFDNVHLGDCHVRSADDMHLFTNARAGGICFG